MAQPIAQTGNAEPGRPPLRQVLVTGAAGFVGRALVQRLLASSDARLTLVDRAFGADTDRSPAALRLRRLSGDFGDAGLLDAALEAPPDTVFHLASVPGSLAEREPALGWQANLAAPIALLQRLAGLAQQPPPRVVFASSVAVYGALPAGGRVDEAAPPRPALSYGAHKLMTEVLLADLTRSGRLDGVALRLPGIVARPLSAGGHGSAFMSDLIRRLWAGEPYRCPVSAAAQCWWMSLGCCIDNLLHAAGMPPHAPADGAPPAVQLPVLTATVGQLVAAIESRSGRSAVVDWQPDAAIEALFGRQPPLDTPRARRLGFRDDGSLADLLRRALAD